MDGEREGDEKYQTTTRGRKKEKKKGPMLMTPKNPENVFMNL